MADNQIIQKKNDIEQIRRKNNKKEKLEKSNGRKISRKVQTMRRIIITITILILGLAFAIPDNGTTKVVNPQFSEAKLSIPKSMNFQGNLYQDGGPVNTTMDMWFGIYDALSGGTLLYSVTKTNVTVNKGWFSVLLDNIPNSVFPVAGPTRY